jgi:selenocysteine-specific elongation factor
MIVLGMAGHVDHGKTALVRALTGVDTDRLPEEKSRGMTTDLGFASMRLEAGGRCLDIGVIDVPGHERYMRNMVAGAWALDLALLAVAADDGWMEQTENHARVLAALGPPRVLLVVTKLDKVDAAQAARAADGAMERALGIFGAQALAGSRIVSAQTGEGIESLKSAIAEEGASLEAARSQGKDKTPYLFVDRIFTQKGSGLIVCGTLAGGSLAVDEEINLLPAGEILRIRSIESLGVGLKTVEGPARVALNVNRPKAEIRRGDLLVKAHAMGSPVLSGREFLARVEALPSSGPGTPIQPRVMKKGGEVELAVGTAGRIATIAPIGKGPWFRLICGADLAFPASLPLALIQQGGAAILGRAWTLREGRTDRDGRKRLADALAGLESLPPALAASTLDERLRPTARPTARVTARLTARLMARPGIGYRDDDVGAAGQDPANQGLSPAAARAEILLREAGASCLDLSPPAPGVRRAVQAPPRKDIETLCDVGIAIPMDRNIFLHREIYEALVEAALRDKAPGDSLDIAEAKARTGFSRKFVIPFLNRLERDGYVKREGDRRMLLKPASPARRPPGGAMTEFGKVGKT